MTARCRESIVIVVLNGLPLHNDVIKWKHFTHYWPFVRGIHRWPVNSQHKWPVTRNFDVFFDVRLDRWLSNQSWGWWFETPSRQLWRHCNAFSNGVNTAQCYQTEEPGLYLMQPTSYFTLPGQSIVFNKKYTVSFKTSGRNGTLAAMYLSSNNFLLLDIYEGIVSIRSM